MSLLTMLDTVQFRRQFQLPPPTELEGRGFRRLWGDSKRWVWDDAAHNATTPRLTWRSTQGRDWLTAEVSLPKLLNSSNVFPLTADDMREALELVSRGVSDVAGVDFEAWGAIIGRVDCCYNYNVGEGNVRPYLLAVSRAEFPNLPRRIIEKSSVTFRNNTRSKEIQFYDKWDEMDERVKEGKATEAQRDAAAGILRLEVRHRTSQACTRLATKYQLRYRTARDLLTPEIAYGEIEDALRDSGLDRPVVALDRRVDEIRNAFGDTPLCRRLLGFISLLDRYGEDFWEKGYGGYKRSKYYKEAKLLRDVGLWLYSAELLPALSIESFERLANAA